MSSSKSTSKEKQKGKGKSVVLRPAKPQGIEFDDKPLWNHVKVLSIPVGGGGNRCWSCNYCNKKVTGSYSKVKAHLLKISNCGVEACKAIKDDVFETLKKEHEVVEKKRAQQHLDARKKIDYVSLPEGSDLLQNKKRKGSISGPLAAAFNVAKRDIADKQAARMFYASALKLSGYSPPTYDTLRTTLLAQEKAHVNRKLQPIKDSWKKKGVSICSDGWSDRQKRPLINIMAASVGGAMFVKAIDASGNIKDADYVANIFLSVIEEIGKENIVQNVTDNGSNFKVAGLTIENKYPHIFWTPCVVHSLNLALKSMCEPPQNSSQHPACKWIANLVTDLHNIRNFIVNHSLPNAIFKSYSNLELLRVAETRFASHIVMAKRLKEVKPALEKMVMDAGWKIYRGDGKNLVDAKAREVKQLIVNDVWWDDLDYLLSFTEPIVDMLRAADTDAPVLHCIYDMWDTMIENVKAIIFEHEDKDHLIGQSDFFDKIHEILEARWTKSNTPLHCIAHSLVPKYYHESWLQGGSNGIRRFAPHEDEEVSTNRSKCFERLFQKNTTHLRNVYVKYGAFSSGSGYFNQPHVIEARMYEEPISWWANHGASTPLLQGLAFKLLSQPASSSCCERNWSTYGHIHSIKRNRLASSRAEDLVFVHCNIRMLSRKKKEYKEGPSKYWDLCGDRFDIDGPPIEFAELSINEPELELVTFDDVMEDVHPDDVGHGIRRFYLWDTIRDICGNYVVNQSVGIVANRFKAKALKSLEAGYHWMINLPSKMVKEHVNCGRLEALINQ
ncbi:unnamed protein product [Camellia sinensis]